MVTGKDVSSGMTSGKIWQNKKICLFNEEVKRVDLPTKGGQRSMKGIWNEAKRK